jgi:hypothetical protein
MFGVSLGKWEDVCGMSLNDISIIERMCVTTLSVMSQHVKSWLMYASCFGLVSGTLQMTSYITLTCGNYYEKHLVPVI